MTKFNPEGKETLTYGECLGPAMEITDPEDAQQYLEEYVKYTQKFLDKEPRDDDMTAEQICKTNLGYFAGYYDSETRVRVEKLFTCSHPIFGSIEKNGQPTAEEAFNLGKKQS
jgi:aromatic ring hydroxylase